jgi:uncharacterized membrane protein YeaQ/YmgE (transglycosylase-associated protein family)
MQINIATLIVWIVVGAIAGWLAGLLLRGHGFGTLANIFIGLIGALVGGILFSLLHITLPSVFNQPLSFTLGDVIIAFIGAVVVILIVSLLRRRGV